uniref:2-hydroxy-3-oxopropionate reductase n=1 Tax=Klebsiella pneumoniae subsp. pneumoniae TaxID=72407 RepID=A0A7G3L8L4_KLEPN|nr:2-hydroxy-3-oxopropionate reductase [Klebsiella pneumoniae subsp. pneumoniae]
MPFAAELDAVVLLVVNAAGAGILFGESGLAAHLKPGTVVMVSSTIASADAQAIAEALAEYQLLMLDAPVSGGAVKAGRRRHDGDGLRSDAAFARLAPVLDAVAGKVYRIGSDIGLGSTVKLSISCWPGCTSPLPPKRWRLPPAPGSHWRRCMTWSPTRRVIPDV